MVRIAERGKDEDDDEEEEEEGEEGKEGKRRDAGGTKMLRYG